MSLDCFLPLRVPFVKKLFRTSISVKRQQNEEECLQPTQLACFPMCPASFACHTGIEHMRTVAQILRARASAGADPGEVKWAEFSPPFF